jgi:hypothetical protein
MQGNEIEMLVMMALSGFIMWRLYSTIGKVEAEAGIKAKPKTSFNPLKKEVEEVAVEAPVVATIEQTLEIAANDEIKAELTRLNTAQPRLFLWNFKNIATKIFEETIEGLGELKIVAATRHLSPKIAAAFLSDITTKKSGETAVVPSLVGIEEMKINSITQAGSEISIDVDYTYTQFKTEVHNTTGVKKQLSNLEKVSETWTLVANTTHPNPTFTVGKI